MRLLTKMLLIIGFAIFALPTATMAHGGEHTLKYSDGPYIVSVTHNVHDHQAGIPIKYNVRLYSTEGALQSFTDANVQIKRAGNTLFATTLASSEFKDADLEYTYPQKGDYVFVVTFNDGSKQLVSSEFPLDVAAGSNEAVQLDTVNTQTVVAFLLGVLVTLLYVKRAQLGKYLERLKVKPKK